MQVLRALDKKEKQKKEHHSPIEGSEHFSFDTSTLASPFVSPSLQKVLPRLSEDDQQARFKLVRVCVCVCVCVCV